MRDHEGPCGDRPDTPSDRHLGLLHAELANERLRSAMARNMETLLDPRLT
ncbi:hypothetical protein [Actinomadura xylanilytica]|nr:hypothetical protein [Actinomadura xylanilytica]MDL4773607.1 hypothetical protein [Actinomadura xylanilytica]